MASSVVMSWRWEERVDVEWVESMGARRFLFLLLKLRRQARTVGRRASTQWERTRWYVSHEEEITRDSRCESKISCVN